MPNNPRIPTTRTGGTDYTDLVFDASFPGLAAPGTAIHAQVAGGGALNVQSGFTDPLPSRTCRITLGVGGANPVVYTVHGVGMDGQQTTDVITATGAGTYEGAKAFRSVTKLTSNVDPVGTTDLATGLGFGIPTDYPNVLSSIDVLSVGGVVEAGVSKTASTGTVIPTTAPNGTRNFTVRCVRKHAHTIGE